MRDWVKNLPLVAVVGGLGLGAVPAQGATIAWAKWKVDTVALAGTAMGDINLPSGKIIVRYKGEVEPESQMGDGEPSWRPATTFSGGNVGNPPWHGNQVSFYGGPGTGTDTILFSQPVTNPIIAIYSLGRVNVRAKLHFMHRPSLTVESGGPSQEHQGSSVIVDGSEVMGREGNGTLQVNGTVTKIQFKVPRYELSCSVTVGVPE